MSKGVLVFGLLVLTFVAATYGPSLAETEGSGIARPTARPGQSIWSFSAVATPVGAPTTDPYLGLRASETAVGLYKAELDQQQTELQMQLARDAATSTAGAQMTQTAVAVAIQTSQAGTQIAAAGSIATSQAAGTQTAFPLTQTALQATLEVEALQLTIHKVQIVVVPILLSIAVVAFGALGWLWLRKRIAARFLQESSMAPDDKGRYSLVPEEAIPGKSKRMINPNLAHRAVHDPAIADDLSTEQALLNARDQRRLEGVRSISESPMMHKIAGALLKAGQPVDPGPVPLTPLIPALPLLNLPDVRLLNQWDGHLLPYGADGNNGLLTVDPAKRPHLMVAGTTGTGKTRYEIRTIVAGALTTGWQVIVIGKQADYIPFQAHPNVTLISANAMREPEKYIQVLKSASDQMFRRDDFLVTKGISTWDRYGGPQTLIVLDDYSAAALMMPQKSAEEVLKWALAIAMDGRKYGLNLLLGLQRATWRCISTDLRSQMGRIALRVESAGDSRVVLGEEGAESLPDRHFLSRLEDGQGLVRGTAFAMTDQETHAFLASRPAREVGPVDWIDVTITDVDPVPSAKTTADVDDDQKIRDILARMIQEDNVSLRRVEREVWGRVRGGQYFTKVQNVYAELKAAGATTTTMPL